MNDIDLNNIIDNPNVTTTSLGIVHHQTKLDVFIIKAFSLLTKNAIIDSNGFNNNNSSSSNSNSPQVNNVSKSGSKNNTPKNIDENEVSKDGSSVTDEVNKIQDNIFNTKAQFIDTFQKISTIYNATLTNVPIDDKSTSPKSSIELFQRLHQIIRELSLSLEASPYSGYFKTVNDNHNLWRIKTDIELQTDQLWQLVTTSILVVYNPETGQIINQNVRNKRINSSNSSPNNSSSNTDGPTGNNTAETTPTSLTNGSTNNTVKKVKKKYTRKKNVSNNTTNNKNKTTNGKNINSQGQGPRHSTSVIPDFPLTQTDATDPANINAQTEQQQQQQQQQLNMNNLDASLPHILQKRLQNVSQDINSRSLAGYYTQPTSPGSDVNAFEFGLPTNDFNTTDYNSALQNAAMNSNGTNLLGTDTNVTNMNNNNDPIWKRRSMTALDGTTSIGGENAVEDLLEFSNTTRNKNRNNMSVMDQVLNNPGGNDSMNINEVVMRKDSNGQDMVLAEQVSKVLKNSYDTLLIEKDQRIHQLERELELQRNETQWLRKMLIEDMGCVRSLLSNTRK